MLSAQRMGTRSAACRMGSAVEPLSAVDWLVPISVLPHFHTVLYYVELAVVGWQLGLLLVHSPTTTHID